MNNQGLKIVTIGGGSSYTPELMHGFISRYEQLPIREIWLVDVAEGSIIDPAGGQFFFRDRIVYGSGVCHFAVHAEKIVDTLSPLRMETAEKSRGIPVGKCCAVDSCARRGDREETNRVLFKDGDILWQLQTGPGRTAAVVVMVAR